jgi:hypothetical protein
MVLVASQAASASIPETHCLPFVCDLATAYDLPNALEIHESALCSRSRAFADPPQAPPVPPAAGNPARLLTFFGMLPNFEPHIILPRLAGLLRPSDYLLFSSNLAPGPDYAAGVARVLPLYDNDLTRDWLLTFLLNLGVERGDGKLRFLIEDDPAGSGLKRIAAYFDFVQPRTIQYEAEHFDFRTGESLRLFFSYRHNPRLAGDLLGPYGFQVLEQWCTRSQEEGVFLAQRTG